MHFTKRTYYTLGAVSALLTFTAGLLLIFNVTMGILVNISSFGMAAAMLFIIARTDVKHQKLLFFISSIFIIFDMFGAGFNSAVISSLAAICGAVAFPIFAFAHVYGEGSETDESVKTMANAAGAGALLQIAGTFVPLSLPIGACIIMAVSAIQAVFMFVLLKLQPKS